MNTLIQKFSEQAKSSVPLGLDVDQWIEIYNQKFAELIIQECCDQIRAIDAMRIKNHFGVEL